MQANQVNWLNSIKYNMDVYEMQLVKNIIPANKSQPIEFRLPELISVRKLGVNRIGGNMAENGEPWLLWRL